MDFSDAVVGGIPLVVSIIGLVQFLKELGVALRVASAGLGLE